jgi:hypothetical protein
MSLIGSGIGILMILTIGLRGWRPAETTSTIAELAGMHPVISQSIKENLIFAL